jgi:hypothetical protein
MGSHNNEVRALSFGGGEHGIDRVGVCQIEFHREIIGLRTEDFAHMQPEELLGSFLFGTVLAGQFGDLAGGEIGRQRKPLCMKHHQGGTERPRASGGLFQRKVRQVTEIDRAKDSRRVEGS